MRILCTGTTGFIGPFIVNELKASGHEVVRFTGDVRDRSTFNAGSFDVVLHMAALVDKRHWKSPKLMDVNVTGTENIVEFYAGAKVVLMSSSDVEEKQPSPYAISKKESENIVLKDPGNLVIRYPSVFGKGDPHDKLVPKLFKKHLENEMLEIFEGGKEYIYVEDLARTITCEMERTGMFRIRGAFISNERMDELVGAACSGSGVRLLPGEGPIFQGLKKIAKAEREGK